MNPSIVNFTKKQIFQLLKKNLQAMDEVEIFIVNFQFLGSLGC